MSFLYFSQPDSSGHGFGPDSAEYSAKIIEVDTVLGRLFNGLASLSLTDKMNVVVLSDHGMTSAQGKPILVTDYVSTELVDFNRSIFGYVSNVYALDKSKVIRL
jgi:predicted AlkP superfamily pyrophosphatase or phosphodiesterase